MRRSPPRAHASTRPAILLGKGAGLGSRDENAAVVVGLEASLESSPPGPKSKRSQPADYLLCDIDLTSGGAEEESKGRCMFPFQRRPPAPRQAPSWELLVCGNCDFPLPARYERDADLISGAPYIGEGTSGLMLEVPLK